MAIGFTPKYTEDVLLNDLTREHFLVMAVETAGKLEWELRHISENGLIAYTNNGMFSWNAEVKIKIEHDHANLSSTSTGSEMMDLGRNKKNIKKFITALEELRPAFTTGELDLKYQELKADWVSQEDDPLKLPPPSASEGIRNFFSIFKPVQGYFITPILININILVFVLMVLSGVSIMMPEGESLLDWGANFRPMTLEGEWWRLLTSCFVHIGILHLLMNLYALLYIGVLLEPLLGRARFISAYLLAGIMASVTSLWWHDLTISAGASGAIFGMYGVFLALLTTNIIDKTTRKPLLTSIAVFVGYNLLYGLKGGIDNAAHIGGLVSGLLIGYAYIPSLKKPGESRLRYSTIGLLASLVLVSSLFAYNNISNDMGEYQEKMRTFSELEEMALEVYNLPGDLPKDTFLYVLTNKGIRYWNENIKLIDELEELNLPDEIRKRNMKLKEYCELRIKSYELLYRAIDEDADRYTDQIKDYNRQIEAIINDLSGDQE